MKSMKTVLIDIDDTLANTNATLLKFVNESSGHNYKYEQITRAMREDPSSDYDSWAQKFLRRPELVARIEPFPDALNAVRALAEAGYELHTVSARREVLHQTTIDWLDANGFLSYITKVHGRRAGQRGFEFKMAIASETDPLAAFDDTYEVTAVLAELGVKTYLISRPWNAEERTTKSMVRVSSFAEGVADLLG